MPLATITRLKPSDIQNLQSQLPSNTSINDVVSYLQYAKNATQPQGKSLNTSCPTCVQQGNPTGMLSSAFQGQTLKYPCTTCGGYMIYNTPQGQLAPPINPLGKDLTGIGTLLPCDLKEAQISFPQSTTFAAIVTSLQGNFATPPTYDCPLCANNDYGIGSTGFTKIQNTKVVCRLCCGMQKTVLQYTLDSNGNAIEVPPTPQQVQGQDILPPIV